MTGGLTLDEPGTDLGVALAIASSFRSRPVLDAHAGGRRGEPLGRAAPRAAARCARARGGAARLRARRRAGVAGRRGARAPGSRSCRSPRCARRSSSCSASAWSRACRRRAKPGNPARCVTPRLPARHAAPRRPARCAAPRPRARPADERRRDPPVRRTRRAAGAGVPKALVPLAGRPLFAEPSRRWSARPRSRRSWWSARSRGCARRSPPPDSRPPRSSRGPRAAASARTRWRAAWPRCRPTCDLVVVHDAARALVTAELIARVVADALAARRGDRRGAARGHAQARDARRDRGHRAARRTVARADAAGVPPRLAGGRARAAAESQSPPPPTTPRWSRRSDIACGSRTGEALNFKITTPEDLRARRGVLLGRAERERT